MRPRTRNHGRWLPAAAALLAVAAPVRVRGADVAGQTSLMAPPLRRGTTRLRATVRPFFNLLGPGGGAISEATAEHYLAAAPLKLSVELVPVAVAMEPDSTGAIAHLRGGAAWASDLLEVGLSFGGRLQNFGPGGMSLAAALRLGAIDGLALKVTYGYALVRNYYTGKRNAAFSNVLTTLDVPITRRAAVVVDGGFSFDVWVYATLGLRHRLTGDGGGGTWFAYGAFGAAWVLDRFPCQYRDPEPCRDAAWALGPTIAVGVERRF